ncbi:MAG: hypothetical protein HN704_09860 [Bacteroidetes bacterium]|jgi:glucosamine kinase|nr:hypothetical protein [Bacteroidota bacterium]MBT6686850.1 hypothetical protein [Bacteroidota bacterium]MBT7144179.1 hypothetical protein [Bacteroidota bacterium]MBT7491898.1 hypothetical protein [Bacteroidota bacterium]
MPMILVADSGSTKTEWYIVSNDIERNFKTAGLNPYFISSEYAEIQINSHFPRDISKNDITDIFFYGAGCSSPQRNSILEVALTKIFSLSRVSIETDLLGAARSMFQNEEGIVAILGTGSNSGFYKKSEIQNSLPSLGYILGDYGSGANIGKQLISKYLNKEFNKNISRNFEKKYNLSQNQILESIYKKPFANRFLASFTYFIKENIEEPPFYDLVYESFMSFFKKNICKYPNYLEANLRFTGSIAYIFKEILMEISDKFNISIDKIEKNPIKGLINFHLVNRK